MPIINWDDVKQQVVEDENFNMNFWHRCIAAAIVRAQGWQHGECCVDAPDTEYDCAEIRDVAVALMLGTDLHTAERKQTPWLLRSSTWPQSLQDEAETEMGGPYIFNQHCPQTALKAIDEYVSSLA